MPDEQRPAGVIALIDGHYYAYRYFFGMPPLSGPGGRPTGVIYAFANLLAQLRGDAAITHVAVVLDTSEPSFRDRLYPDYKAHRDPMPDALRAQMPDIDTICAATHVPVLRAPGYEADDLLVTLAKQAAATGLDVRLLTKDKDVDQVLSDRIRTWDPGKGEQRGPAELLAEKGIRPDQVIDYLSLIGDTSDNVPGVDGVGPKTATKLLAEHGSLTAVLAAADGMKGKLKERLIAFRPQAELTRTLITLVDVPAAPPIAALAKSAAPLDAAAYESFGFSLARFAAVATRPATPEAAPYRTLTLAELPELVRTLRAVGRFALDTETTGLDPVTAKLVGISVAWGEHDGYGARWIPFAGIGAVIDWEQARPLLAPLLADPAVRKIGQNIKYDARVLMRHGAPVSGYDGDTMLASWLLDPGRDSHGIDHLATLFLGETKIATKDVVDLDGGQTMADVPVEQVARYACEDAQCCWRLAQLLEAKLAEQGLLDVYRTQEVPVALCLARIEDAGIAIDRSALARTQDHLAAYRDEVLAAIHRIAGNDFNPASPKQVGELLFDKLKLPVISRTKSGPSTDASVLEALRAHHELPELLLQHRQLAKLLGTYLAKLPEHISADGRIRTNLKQTAAETGRLASDGPNLQAIPKKTDLGREIRSGFIAAPGHVLIAADYSQIELRVLAHLSGDAVLRQAFAEERDIHRFVAAEVNGVHEALVTPQQRHAAKAVNFGIIYGQTAFGLASQLGIDRGAAQRFIDAYFLRFAGVRAYIDRTIAETATRGYALTLAGRRRYVPQLSSGNRNEHMHGERVALNSTIQGSAADIIKRAMLRLDERLGADARLILQIHDELIVEAPQERAATASAALEDAMCGAWTLDVPLVATTRVGASWYDI